jgi:hypothetical protein
MGTYVPPPRSRNDCANSREANRPVSAWKRLFTNAERLPWLVRHVVPAATTIYGPSAFVLLPATHVPLTTYSSFARGWIASINSPALWSGKNGICAPGA